MTLLKGNNYMDREEMEDVIDKVMAEADIDQDGHLSLSEFKHILMKCPDFGRFVLKILTIIFNYIPIRFYFFLNFQQCQKISTPGFDPGTRHIYTIHPKSLLIMTSDLISESAQQNILQVMEFQIQI